MPLTSAQKQVAHRERENVKMARYERVLQEAIDPEVIDALQSLYDRVWFIIGVNDPVAIRAKTALDKTKDTPA